MADVGTAVQHETATAAADDTQKATATDNQALDVDAEKPTSMEAAAETPDDPTFYRRLVASATGLAVLCVFFALIMEHDEEHGFGFQTAWEAGLLFPFILGFLILLQGWGKLVSPKAYIVDVGAFRMGIPPAAIGAFFIIVEVYTGPAMVMGALTGDFGSLLTVAAAGAILDIVGYVTLSLTAYIRGLAYTWRFECHRADGACINNCTCFGIYGAQKLSIWVLLQDVIVVAETVFVAYRIFSNSTM